jgi:hypothetical protein
MAPMANNNHLSHPTCTNEMCDCILPHEFNTASSIKYRQSSPHVTTLINGNDRFKSESCWHAEQRAHIGAK